MANTVAVGVTAQDNGFKQSLSQMAASASQFAREVGASGKGVQSLNGAFKTAKKAAMDLGLAYKQLSEEAKNSDFGKELNAQLEQAKKAAAELQDLKNDMAQEIKNRSSDTAGWDAAAQGINAVGSSATALVGIYTSLAGESEDATQALRTMATVQASVNAVITVGNALQKQSALMTGISIIQTKAAAAAKALETKATIGATAAQRVFNAVAKANPYVLLATAVLAVGSALVAFAKESSEASKEQERMKKEAEEAEKAEQRFADNVSQGAAEMSVKLAALKKELEAAGNSTEKKKEICERYKDVIDIAGGSVDNLTGAEVDYDAEFGRMQQSLIKRAIAMAKYQEAIELAKKQLQALANAETRQAQMASLSTNKLYTREEAEKIGFQYFTEEKSHYTMVDPTGRAYEQEYTVGFRLSEKDKARAVADAKAEGQRIADNLQNEIKKKLDIGNQYLADATGTNPRKHTTTTRSPRTNKNTRGNKNTTKTEQTQLEKLNKLYDTTARKLENIKGDDDNARAARRKIYDDLVAINDKRLEFYDIKTDNGFKNTIDTLKDSLGLLDETSAKYKEIKQDIIDVNNERATEIMSTGTTVDNVKKILPILEENLTYLEENSDQWVATKNAINAYKEAVSELDSEHMVGTLGWLQDVISNKQELQLEISIDNLQALVEAHDEITQLEDKEHFIQLSLELFNVSTFKARYDKLLKEFSNNIEIIPVIKKQMLDDAANELNAKLELFNAGIINFDELKSEWDKLTEYMSSNGIDTSKFSREFISSLKSELENAIQSSLSFDATNINGFVKQLSDLKSKMLDMGASSQEVFTTLYAAGESAFNQLKDLYDKGFIDKTKYNELIDELRDELKELGIDIPLNKTTGEVSQNLQDATDAVANLGSAFSALGEMQEDPALKVAGIVAQAIANIALGAGKAIAQAGDMGPWGWIAFGAAIMAQMAGMIAQIHSATQYAEGGIVGGSTTMGDKVIARLNAGEMVLNSTQQSRLFNMIDHGNLIENDGPQVSTVRIKGSDIFLALKNYGKVTNKKL